MPTRFMETLLINSDEPFVQVLINALPSQTGLQSLKGVGFLRAKYGIQTASTKEPYGNVTINSKVIKNV